jgi:hypothetical protein
VSRRLKIVIERLARQLARPSRRGARQSRRVGMLHVLDPQPPPGAAGRWQTILVYSDQFLLLVDEFRAAQARPVLLTLQASTPLRGSRRRYVTRDAAGPLALHPLGDYAVERQRGVLTLRQRLAQGRFLLALTRDPDAAARVLNGWAVEIRSQGRIYHLLHSNRSRRVRPLGPVQTDARFALADWPAGVEQAAAASWDAQLHLLEVSQISWGGQRKATTTTPVDLLYQLAQGASVQP